MRLMERLATWSKTFSSGCLAGLLVGCDAGRAGDPEAAEELDFAPDGESRSRAINRNAAGQLTLGLRYSCCYSWQLSPPSGWRRQESLSGPKWPNSGSSPTVSFTCPHAKAGRFAMIRWRLLSVPESTASHEHLERLLWSPEPLDMSSIGSLLAPGIVAGMKPITVERVNFPGAERAIVIFSRLQQCQDEEPVFRYVVVFGDRELNCQGASRWYRESLQYAATESEFESNEAVAIEALRTFRRNLMSPERLARMPLRLGIR